MNILSKNNIFFQIAFFFGSFAGIGLNPPKAHTANANDLVQMGIDAYIQELLKTNNEIRLLKNKLKEQDLQFELIAPKKPWTLASTVATQQSISNSKSGQNWQTQLEKEFASIGSALEIQAGKGLGNDSTDFSLTYTQSMLKNRFGSLLDSKNLEAENQIQLIKLNVFEDVEKKLLQFVLEYVEYSKYQEMLNNIQKRYFNALRLQKELKKRQSKYIANDLDLNLANLQVLERKLNKDQVQDKLDMQKRVLLDQINAEKIDFKIFDQDFKDRLVAKVDANEVKLKNTRTFRLIDYKLNLIKVRLDHQRKLEKPELGLFIGVNSKRQNSIDPSSDGTSQVIGATLSMDLGESEINRGKLNDLMFQSNQAQMEKTTSLSNIQANYRRLKKRAEQLITNIQLIKIKTALQWKVLKQQKEQFDIGRASLNDLIRSQDGLNQIELSQIEKKYELIKIYYELLEIEDKLLNAELFGG